MFILFPKISDELKTPDGRQCYDPTDIVMRTLKLIKVEPSPIICRALKGLIESPSLAFRFVRACPPIRLVAMITSA
jgi:hypothetical protein